MPETEIDIERLYYQDLREKKTTATGVRGRASRLGRVGSMVMPSDRLSGREKRDYRRPGPLITYSLYEDLVSFEVFDQMPYRQQVQLLSRWRQKYSDDAICQQWGLSRYGLEVIVEVLGV
ncbi:hypothetical protein H1S01_11755 [Heliobacterium chlorum]|uniref:Transposase n=1 Tax=Heliobacterium chlorum TaxID=2698 RepID=A0ABR7T5S2_HELCL|nr:hypothetical protein [Heliobacterium chlorum]MBC9785184.1 hypothetical protein [Heliobacterium chlorum]